MTCSPTPSSGTLVVRRQPPIVRAAVASLLPGVCGLLMVDAGLGGRVALGLLALVGLAAAVLLWRKVALAGRLGLRLDDSGVTLVSLRGGWLTEERHLPWRHVSRVELAGPSPASLSRFAPPEAEKDLARLTKSLAGALELRPRRRPLQPLIIHGESGQRPLDGRESWLQRSPLLASVTWLAGEIERRATGAAGWMDTLEEADEALTAAKCRHCGGSVDVALDEPDVACSFCGGAAPYAPEAVAAIGRLRRLVDDVGKQLRQIRSRFLVTPTARRTEGRSVHATRMAGADGAAALRRIVGG